MIGFRGWHGVTDSRHSLLCIAYEPISGVLACRFQSRNEPYLYEGVPENIYRILLRTPYAGSYLRKHVIGKYPQLGENIPEPYQPTEQPTPKEIPVIEVPTPTLNLFGEVIRIKSQKKHKKDLMHS